MEEGKKPFKRPPKKYQPKGISILYEDRDILVVDKASGLLTVSTEMAEDNTAYYLLTDYVRKGNRKSRQRVFIVHRLDRDTSGVLVFAKSEEAKHFLQSEWQRVEKKYVALVHGTLPEKQGVLSSYLTENSIHKVYSVPDARRGKLAQTRYTVLRQTPDYSLLEIDLLTGRKNQIRVQLSDIGCPIVGDKKYGRKDKGIKRLTLHAASITIPHPHSKQRMTFTTRVPVYFKSLMKGAEGPSTARFGSSTGNGSGRE